VALDVPEGRVLRTVDIEITHDADPARGSFDPTAIDFRVFHGCCLATMDKSSIARESGATIKYQ
jgi:hypothetical protein